MFPPPIRRARLSILLLLLLAVLSCRGLPPTADATANSPQPTAVQAAGPTNCPVFPADNIWNTPVDHLPVHPMSAGYITSIGTGESFHADFGAGIWPPESGGPIGIPVTFVDATTDMANVQFEYADESDPGPYPIPPDAAIEGGPDADGDRHILLIDSDACILYELYRAFPLAGGRWEAGSGAIFNLRDSRLRPDGWTSADAAGLPIYPGLVRYDEVAAGEITHALRFTAPQTQSAHVWPARHDASDLTAAQYPPLGQRFRLRADFDLSPFAPEVQVILQAMKRYGIILADNGSPWYVSGMPDERWDNDTLSQLSELRGTDFEAVDVSSLMVGPDSGQATIRPQAIFIPAVTATAVK